MVDGTDAGNLVNDVVEMLPTAAWGQDLATALTTAHDRTGVHKTGASYPSPVFSGTATGTYTLGGTPTYPTGSVAATGLTNPYKFRVYLNSAQNTSAGAFARVLCDARTYDTGLNVDITTNKGRFAAPVAGFYQFNGAVNATGASGTTVFMASLFKNGSEELRGNEQSTSAASGALGSTVSDLIQLAATDYVELQVFCNGTIPLAAFTQTTSFSGFLVSAT